METFKPCWLSPPGETISSVLEERRLTIRQFAQQMGKSEKSVVELLNGRLPIDVPIARKLAAVLGSSEGFWLNRESNYRKQLAGFTRESARESSKAWLGEIPWKEMEKLGWLESASDLE